MDQILFGKLQDFKARLAIDRNNLEQECQVQSPLYGEIAEEVQTAKYLRNQAKADFEHAEAELLCDVKEKPALFGFDKSPAGDHANAKVKCQPKYIELQKVYFDAERTYGALNGLLEEAAQRKSMLRDLVDLFVHQYFSNQDLSTPSSRVSRMAGNDKNENFEAALADIRKRRVEERRQDNDESVSEG